MKRTLLISILMAFSFTMAISQITLTWDDFPQIGHLVVTAVDDVTPVDPGQPGPDQVWDFSNLVAVTTDSVYYVSPEGMPGATHYPEANIASNHNPGSFPNGGYNVNYWQLSENHLKGVADESLIYFFGNMYFAIHLDFDPPTNQLAFPFTYGSTNVQDFSMIWVMAVRDGNITTDSSMTVSHVNMDCLADAYGTMILPDASFPVLRVRESWNSVDSSFTWNGSAWEFSETSTSNWEQYRWYANGIGEVGFWNPEDRRAPGFTFFKSNTIVGMEETTGLQDLTLSPNPVYSTLRVSTGQPFDRYEILNVRGEAVSSGDVADVDVSRLSRGMYIIRVYLGNTFVTGKFYKM